MPGKVGAIEPGDLVNRTLPPGRRGRIVTSPRSVPMIQQIGSDDRGPDSHEVLPAPARGGVASAQGGIMAHEPHTDNGTPLAHQRRAALRDALQLWAASQERAPISPAELHEHAPPWYAAVARDACPR